MSITASATSASNQEGGRRRCWWLALSNSSSKSSCPFLLGHMSRLRRSHLRGDEYGYSPTEPDPQRTAHRSSTLTARGFSQAHLLGRSSRPVMPLSARSCRDEHAPRLASSGPVVEELLSRRLVAVERLSWEPVGISGRREVGPVRLVFDNGYSLVLSGSTAWTLNMRVTSPG